MEVLLHGSYCVIQNFLFSQSHVLCKQNSFRKYLFFYCFVAYKGKPCTLFFWNGSFKYVFWPPSRQIAFFKLLQCKKKNLETTIRWGSVELVSLTCGFWAFLNNTGKRKYCYSFSLQFWTVWEDHWTIRHEMNGTILTCPTLYFYFFSYSTGVTRALHILGMHPNTKFCP